jgi:hypothetical protein
MVVDGPDAGRILDTARGIIIGIRRCPSEAAFDELLGAAQRHGVAVFAIAWALVRLAADSSTPSHDFVDAQLAAQYEWGHLFEQPALSIC